MRHNISYRKLHIASFQKVLEIILFITVPALEETPADTPAVWWIFQDEVRAVIQIFRNFSKIHIFLDI